MVKVLLFSGGMDSLLALRSVVGDVSCVFVDIDHKYNSKEREACRNMPFDVNFIRGADIGKHEQPSGIIPFRNAEFILCAAQYGNEILLGVTAGEINSDKSPEFFAAMQNVLNISMAKQYWNDVEPNYKVYSPIRTKTKAQLIADYVANGHSIETLKATVSCYSGQSAKQCGDCPSCFKRWVAMTLNGFDESYDKSPVVWAQNNGIIEKATDGTYNSQRAAEVLRALHLEGRGIGND